MICEDTPTKGGRNSEFEMKQSTMSKRTGYWKWECVGSKGADAMHMHIYILHILGTKKEEGHAGERVC